MITVKFAYISFGTYGINDLNSLKALTDTLRLGSLVCFMIISIILEANLNWVIYYGYFIIKLIISVNDYCLIFQSFISHLFIISSKVLNYYGKFNIFFFFLIDEFKITSRLSRFCVFLGLYIVSYCFISIFLYF